MSDLKESISRESSNIPYLAIIIDSGLPIQMHLIAERIILDSIILDKTVMRSSL